MTNGLNLRKFIGWVSLIVGVVVALIILWWIYQQGNLKVTITNYSGGVVSYHLIDYKTKKETVLESSSGELSVRLSKGDYEIVALSEKGSHVAIGSVPGWMGTGRIDIELKPEFGRQFIANNNGACIEPTDEALLSFDCEGPITGIKTHVPGTDKVPPYAFQHPLPGLTGTIESVLDSSAGRLLLVSTPISQYDEGLPPSAHLIYRLTGQGSQVVDPKPIVELKSLNESVKYSAVNYKGGFIAYDSNFDDATLYSSFDSDNARKLDTFSNQEEGVSFRGINIRGEQITTLFSNNPEGAKQASEVVVGNIDSQTHYRFSKSYDFAASCGSNMLCLVGGEGLDVYKLTSERAEFVYGLRSVKSVQSFGDNLVANVKNRLINLDVDEKKGDAFYDLGDFTLDSIKPSGADYLVGVRSGQSRYALLLSADIENDSIDKKFSELSKNTEIKHVTIFKNSIFISPNVGELVYDEASGQFGYSKVRRDNFAGKLPAILQEANIDTSKYKVVNTLP